MGTVTLRFRSLTWFAAGALIATAVSLMFASAWRADAAPGDTDSTFVGIAPCRLADTRPAPNRVGPAATLGPGETQPFTVHGVNGECSIPDEAVAVSMNVTALRATDLSFLTIWPDGERPLAASLNPAPGQPPVPNAVTVDLSDVGGFNVFNDVGNVDIVVDVNGYHQRTSLTDLHERVATLEAGLDTADAGIADNADALAVLDAAQPFTVMDHNPLAEIIPSDKALTLASVDVVAPVDGNVLVSYSLYTIVPNATAVCSVGRDGEIVGFGNQDSPGGLLGGGNFAGSAVFSVTAGEIATFVLACSDPSDDAGGGFSPTLVATFTPAP